MIEMIKKIAVGAALLALGGCMGQQLADVKTMKPTGSAFETGLFKEYVALSQGEYDEADWTDSDFFASKGGMAAMGKEEGPQAIAGRDLPGDKVDEMTKARERLVRALNAGGRQQMAGVAARAQAMFDCWMQEQEENFQPEDIARCREDLYSLLGTLEPKPKPAPPPPPPPAPKPVAKPKPVGPFVVMFDFDSADVNKLSKLVVDLIIAEAKGSNPNMISLSGHTDRAGKDGYNMVLSKKRVDAVSAALIAGGVPASKVNKAIFGEEKPAKKTDDGVRAAKNRRVEVKFEF